MAPSFRRWFTRCLSLWVRPDVLPTRPGDLLDPDLPVLYMLEFGGLADRAALAIATEHHALTAPSANLHYGALSESSSIDVLKIRSRRWLSRHPSEGSPRLHRILAAAADEGAGELQIVPVAVYWGRAPSRDASGLQLLFSENWRLSGRLRKFITTLVHGRNTLIQFSQPLSLRTLVSSTDEPALLSRKLLRILRVHFRQRRIASLGPDLSHRRTLIGQVVADAGVRRAIVSEAGNEVRQHRKLQRRAEAYATEIAADMSYTIARLFQRPLTRLWTGLYDGVDIEGVERLRRVADGHEVVYVPCHRSHIDYLLLSYILYQHGFSLPHVAAGINLNLPVVGGLLRSGGAFFLRRSFSGNALYAAVFSAYLKEIQQRGHSIEYFIEGGRSRTGRLLPPKGGMLSMTAHAYLRNPRVPVIFVPVYFGYERLIEGRSFTSELAGGSKHKETVFALIKSLRRLREEYGRVRVNFGEPIDLNALLDQHRQDWREAEIGIRKPDWLRPVVSELGCLIMQRINQAASITPVSLLAAVLLASARGALSVKEVESRLQLYRYLIEATHAGSLVNIPEVADGEAIAQAVRLGFVEVVDDPLGKVVRILPGQAAPITYFRNNILHLLVLPALVAGTFLNRPRQNLAGIEHLVALSYPFLQAEFFLEATLTTERLTRSVRALSDRGLIQADGEMKNVNGSGGDRADGNGTDADKFDDGGAQDRGVSDDAWQRARTGSEESVSLLQLAQLIGPVLERYYLTAVLLYRASADGVERQALAARCDACAQRLALTHGRQATDLYDRHLFGTFIDTLIDRQLLDVRDGRLHITEGLQAMEAEADVLVGEVERQAIVHASQAVSTAAVD